MNLRDRYTHHTQSAYSLKLYLPEHSHKEPPNSVLTAASNETFTQADKITAESYRVADVAHNAKSIIENLDREFEAQTKLHGKDIGFLFFATSLQCVRQYFFTDFKTRLGNQDAAKNTKGHIEEHSDRHHRLYNPSVEQIKHNPVPFDTTFGGPEMAEQITETLKQSRSSLLFPFYHLQNNQEHYKHNREDSAEEESLLQIVAGFLRNHSYCAWTNGTA